MLLRVEALGQLAGTQWHTLQGLAAITPPIPGEPLRGLLKMAMNDVLDVTEMTPGHSGGSGAVRVHARRRHVARPAPCRGRVPPVRCRRRDGELAVPLPGGFRPRHPVDPHAR